MLRIMCKSKIHRARITETDLHYEGSIGIDKTLLDASDIFEYEVVQVLNVETGARFETYTICEKANSGRVVLYGPAARLGTAGDVVIVIAKTFLATEKIDTLKPRVVYVNKNNKIIQK